MKNLTWQNPEQLFVAQELINKVKSKCCGIKGKYKSYGGKKDDGSVYSDYWDETTTLSVSLHTYNGVKYISLVYQNDKLNSLRKENEKNEL